ALLVDMTHIAGLKEACVEGILSLDRHVPVALEHRGTLDQDLAVGCDLHVQICERRPNTAGTIRRGIVQGDDGRSFCQSVSLKNADADGGIPILDVATERRAAGDEYLDLAAERVADLAE